ncbi:HepT-like ribonuclease domain-containing protein [Rathayibacter sp. VKM Ac-2630]|uniref:HepT-like ribonuclease domain-containing protein n=1 Tax=Rathayibacter sp. VKM Ac-2630 TaxID=1938617 RepID=UPI0009820EAE|nr:HepT-like ribonuclease domain-containing protein [Rathayibacter sp. VKM Ac-2630]OOB91500.1 hypothetical protein B0T42_05770 [Rathayibacter sp. VKM Ac-2630]
MSRIPLHRLQDVLEALSAIEQHLARGDLGDGLVFDAVRMRLVEIGEAVKDLPADLPATESGTPWRDITGMRDWLAHHYFDTTHAVVRATVESELPALRAAIERMHARVAPDDGA